MVWDSISQLDFYMTDGSTLTGASSTTQWTDYEVEKPEELA